MGKEALLKQADEALHRAEQLLLSSTYQGESELQALEAVAEALHKAKGKGSRSAAAAFRALRDYVDLVLGQRKAAQYRNIRPGDSMEFGPISSHTRPNTIVLDQNLNVIGKADNTKKEVRLASGYKTTILEGLRQNTGSGLLQSAVAAVEEWGSH